MSLRLNARQLDRVLDRYTPPASLDDPVRGSRVPDLYCRQCGETGRPFLKGRDCRCGGVLESIPAEEWRWCRSCNGVGIACHPGECRGLGVVLRRLTDD